MKIITININFMKFIITNKEYNIHDINATYQNRWPTYSKKSKDEGKNACSIRGRKDKKHTQIILAGKHDGNLGTVAYMKV
jgi:hypothetical protein